MAVGRVEQVISLRGENNTKQAVEEAKSGLLGLGAASKQVAEKSGDLERGFRGVKDLVGNLGGTNLAPFIDGLGGVEAVIKGFGPALNPLTIGLTAAAGAAYLVYENVEKARVAALQQQIRELEIAGESVAQTAKKLGLSSELLGVDREIESIESIQNEARADANKLRAAEKQLLEATIEKDKEKIRLAEQEISRVKDLIVQDTIRLEIEKSGLKELDSLKAKDERARRERLQAEDAINGTMDFRERIERRTVVRTQQLNDLKREEERIQYRLSLGDFNREKQEKRLTEIYMERKKLQGEELADAQQVEAKRKERADKAKQYAADERAALSSLAQARADAASAGGAAEDQVYKLQIAAIAAVERAEIRAAQLAESTAKARAAKIEVIELAAEAKRDKLLEDAATRQGERERASEEGAKRVLDAQLAVQDQLSKARIAAATDPELKFELTVTALQIEQQRKLEEARTNQLLAASDLAAKEEAIAIETAQAIAAAEKEKQNAQKKTADELQANRQKTIDAAADTVSTAASLVASFQGKGGLGTALVETAKQVKSVSAGWNENKNQAGALIGAVGNVASAFVDGEREKAGILAIMETAQAIASAAIGDVPGAIAHGSAAALYGSVAGGLISGGGAAAAPSAGGGGFAAGGATAGGTGGPSGPATTVINFNAPLGTAYEIGKSVVKAQKAAGSSGWSPNMAMGV